MDASAFAEAVSLGDRLSLEHAVSLYRGPLLLECTEPSAAAARAECERQYLECLRRLGDHAGARQFFEECLQIGRDLGDKRLIANAIHGLAHMAFNLNDYPAARDYYAEELSLARAMADRELAARTLHRLGSVEQALGDYSAARRLFEESLFAAEDLAYRDLESAVLHSLGSTACAQADYVTARTCFEQRLSLSEERGDKPGFSYTLDVIGALMAAQKQDHQAVLLCAAAQTLRESLGMSSPVNRLVTPILEAARTAFGEPVFQLSGEAGRALTQDEAAVIARQQAPSEDDSR